MRKLFTLICFISFTILCNAQGHWNIGYIKVDAIKKEHVGRIVRLDFRTSNPIISPDGLRHLRGYVRATDTATFRIDTSLFIVVEKRKIFVDHGAYSDQFLECINCRDLTILFFDARIMEVEPNSVVFQLDIETLTSGKAKVKESKMVTIDRSQLDGVMFELKE